MFISFHFVKHLSDRKKVCIIHIYKTVYIMDVLQPKQNIYSIGINFSLNLKII